jgi:hypothetical protein
MEVARVLAEATVLVKAGHAGSGWDAFRDVLMQQVGGGKPALLDSCRLDLQALYTAGPPQLRTPPKTEDRVALKSQWPMIEAVALWSCIGAAAATLGHDGDDEARTKLAAHLEATMSFIDLSKASREMAVLESWYVAPAPLPFSAVSRVVGHVFGVSTRALS